MNPASNPDPTDAQVPAQRSGRYRYCAGRPLDPIEATHPELTADGSPAIESSGVPDSPAALMNEFDSISCQDGVVWVAVGEHEEVEREYHLAFGELEQLHALVDKSDHIPDDWYNRLALLLTF